jgi:Death domain
MEVMLNGRRDQRDWKALARDLGYTSSRIASFEQRALEKQTGPTRHLFADWAKREDSTVANLLQALCNIGRHDVTLVLLPIQQATAATLPRTRYKPISVV